MIHIRSRIKRLKRSVETIYPSIFDNIEVKKELARLHDQFVMVPTEKARNNIVFVCKSHYINCILEELGFISASGNKFSLTRIGIG